MGKASSKKKAGREFEELITRIESSGLPDGAEVTSPDKLPDRASGTLREVDASIRYTLGTVPVLVTIECRDRSRAAEPRWIDEIISKRNDLGANVAIGVSAKGFSKAALAKAKAHGVLLRETKTLDAREILKLEPTVKYLCVHLLRVDVLLQDEELETTALCLDGSPFVSSAPFISDTETDKEASLDRLMDEISRAPNLNWPEYSETESRRTIKLNKSTYIVRTTSGVKRAFALALTFTGGATEAPLKLERAFDYVTGGNERLVQFQNWTGNPEIFGKSVNLGVEVLLK